MTHLLPFDIHLLQFKPTARHVPLETSKYTWRSSNSPHHNTTNRKHIYRSLSTEASLATTRSTPRPLNPQLGWFKMCTEKDYFHNCGHPTRNRPSRKKTCTEAKHGFKC